MLIMNLKKRQIYIIFIFLILLTGIFIVNAAINVDKLKAYHSGTRINFSIDGTARTLQYAITSNRLMGGYNYGSSSAPNPGHNASEIWVSVNGNEKTLQNALITGLCGNITTTKYSTPNLLVYQYANEINISIGTSEMSLQNAIDTGKFCSLWGTGSCTGTCGGTGTRTVYCKRSDGAQIADGFCPAATKPSTSCTPPCTWQVVRSSGCEVGGDCTRDWLLKECCKYGLYCKGCSITESEACHLDVTCDSNIAGQACSKGTTAFCDIYGCIWRKSQGRKGKGWTHMYFVCG